MLLLSFITLFVFTNRSKIHAINDKQKNNTESTKNIINAINYNNAVLHEQNQYINDFFNNASNSFQDINVEAVENSSNVSTTDSNIHFQEMMRNYDAISHLI